MTEDHLHELDALVRLSDTLTRATAGDGHAIHAMASALSVRLKTLAAAVRLASAATTPFPSENRL